MSAGGMKRLRLRRHVLPLALALIAGGVGTTLRAEVLKDPMAGEYYTAEELAALSGGDQREYCERMERTLETLQAEFQRYQGGVDSLAALVDTMRTQSIDVSAEIRDLNAELRELRVRRKSIQSYTTREGDTLRSVAKTLYGDPLRWNALFDANRDKITSEDGTLPPGIVLKVPRIE